MNFTIHQGDNRLTLKTLEDNSVDAIVTDPPYGIDFLGKAWDANTGALETYKECLRVLKPGGYILAFSAARTYHHLAVTLEQAGFEIRDQLMWLYASGFPKAQDIGKAIERRAGTRENAKSGDKWTNADEGNGTNTTTCSMCGKTNVQIGIGFNCQNKDCEFIEKLKPADNEWAGWKTALKPAHEPICMARKPFKGSTIDNVLEHGVGALNIDATRIDWDEKAKANIQRQNALGGEIVGGGIAKYATVGEDAGTKHDTQRITINEQGRFPSNVLGEVEGYQKFFYCPKVSRKERHCGFEDPGPQTRRARDQNGNVLDYPGKVDGASGTVLVEQFQLDNKGNNHPTVKPVALMKYLIKLVTPPNSLVLDPFCGSGSTGMAAVDLGHEFIGCELDENYVDIANRRITAWNTEEYDNQFGALFETE